jgi:hypothetical protein
MREVYHHRDPILNQRCYGSRAVRRLAAFVILAALIPASGCVVVRAHQRENLAKRPMIDDRDPGEERFGAHLEGSREGAEGGTGQPGGGCGCN